MAMAFVCFCWRAIGRSSLFLIHSGVSLSWFISCEFGSQESKLFFVVIYDLGEPFLSKLHFCKLSSYPHTFRMIVWNLAQFLGLCFTIPFILALVVG